MISSSQEDLEFKTLEEVLKQLEKAGMWLKMCKCKFLMIEIDILVIQSQRGIETYSVESLTYCTGPRPKNVSDLKAFLGLVNYYG